MKFIIASVVALASVAIAAPNAQVCKPATYRCEPNKPAWDVCNTAGQWVFAGDCPPKTVCQFDAQNGSPYCVPPGFTIP